MLGGVAERHGTVQAVDGIDPRLARPASAAPNGADEPTLLAMPLGLLLDSVTPEGMCRQPEVAVREVHGHHRSARSA